VAEITGFEALIRWQHPERGLLSPQAFLPFMEETGFIVEINRCVREQAIPQLGDWQQSYPRTPNILMNINLSASDFMTPNTSIESSVMRSNCSEEV
ncbi:unnamed protein product, partial [Acidithrix sp. C25]